MGKPKANRRVSPKEKGKRGDPPAERAKGGAAPRTGMARDVGAVVLFAAALGSGLSLATYSSLDAALIAHGIAPANLVGPVGHRTASALYGVLGLSALVLPFGLGAAAWRLFRGAPPRITLVSAGAYTVLTLSVATLGHLALAGSVSLPFPPGGAVGAALARPSVHAFSLWGSVILVGATATVAAIVACDLKVQTVGAALWRALAATAGFLSRRLATAVDEHRVAVAELRAEEAAERERRLAAEQLAETAEIEANGEEAHEEARAVAGALALEQLRRDTFEDPAWVEGLAPAPEPREEAEGAGEGEPAAEEPPRRRRKAREPEKAVEVRAELEDPAALPVPARAEKPEIVVSQAMLERARKKEKKKEAPAFAFQKAGDVFQLPATDLLDVHDEKAKDLDTAGLTRTAEVIVATLAQHGVDGTIKHIRPGPVVTLYEFSPVAGVKLARIENLDKELTMALSATRIRIIAPIPGKGVVGIEVPNRDRATVWLRDILESESFASAGGFLPLGLGKNIEGIPYCVDLQRMPHLLIAGTTGSGKSVGLNTMILSMLFRQTPAEVRMIMVDPKMTELSTYEDIPHLLLPVVTDPQKAARALQWAVDEMERRTQILADTGSKDLKSYNGKVEKLRTEGRTFEDRDEAAPPRKLVVVDVAAGESEDEVSARAASDAAAGGEWHPLPGEAVAGSPEFEDPTAPPPADPVAARDEKKLPQKLPYIVVVIDELADLMMTAPREVEISLARLAQKARATGIHLIVATQRPSTDVVTGMIKNNFPARITFRLASRHDSQTIINGPGAETLLGDGDMLVLTATAPVTRVQGAFVSEEELHRVVGFLKEQGKPVYDESILKAREGAGPGGYDPDEDDPVYDQAIDLVSRMEEVSVSKLQREMRLGYNKAAKIIERMEREGIVGPPNGVKPRQVLIRPAGEASAIPNV
ncbi:cell divisionFtsK/SpoIIIE [Anaeromyxobacter sp. K]|uniref:DNA translocase FtsK n=1 Tax=Anaeromyxobacter sp. (strain K) TaxID=447217 RepID=UPI00015F927B|nr:DNA translocase FtsK [Anaeromyxobacter sp. K]ACG75527.1 cell divisionFtsK/SpoIIIE [Anaeromyxobacter sp. K]